MNTSALSVSVTARLLHSDARTVRYLLGAGQLAGRRSPHHWIILRSDLERFVADVCARHGVTVYALTPTALLTVAEVAVALGRSARTIRLQAQRRHLPAFKIGRTWRFWREDIIKHNTVADMLATPASKMVASSVIERVDL